MKSLKNRFSIALVLICLFSVNANAQSLKLQLVFSQPKYAPGDTAYFRGRLFSEGNMKLATGKRVISLKLLGSDGKIHFHNRVVFQDGSCANQLILTTNPDQYTLLAYSEDLSRQGNNTPIFKSPFVIAGEKSVINKSSIPPEQSRVITSVIPDKEKYSARQPVNVQLSITDMDSKPIEGDFSVSVIHSDLFEDATSMNSLSVGNESAVNPMGNNKTMSYYFKGKVITEKALADSTLVTFYLNRNDFVYPLYINSSGTFEFPLFKEFGDERIYYTITRKGAKVMGTIISDEPVIRNDSLRAVTMASAVEDTYSSFVKRRNVVMKSFLYYSNRLPQDNYEEWLDSDFDIELDKFEPFSSMQELLGNIVQMVRYRKKDNEEMVRVFLRDNAIYATVDPLYIIDGVMTDNTKYFLNLLPANVDKIGILRSQETLSRYGELGKNGIILVRTKPTAREELPSNQHELFVTGISKSIPFKSPSYANQKQSNIPDLRSTLYWNPKILTDNQGKSSFSFYTGDATGSFKIRVEGMTNNGILFTKEIPFTVSYEKP